MILHLSNTTQILAEREPLVDVNITDNEVKVVVDMPRIKKTALR
jgi:HSP20 family protein